MSKMQGLRHISSEHVFSLNYAKCRIQLNTCKLNVFFFMLVNEVPKLCRDFSQNKAVVKLL